MARKRNHFWSWHCLPKKQWHVYYTDNDGVDQFIGGEMERRWARHIAKLLNTMQAVR